MPVNNNCLPKSKCDRRYAFLGDIVVMLISHRHATAIAPFTRVTNICISASISKHLFIVITRFACFGQYECTKSSKFDSKND